MGTSQGYEAPTTPQWKNLKRQVTIDAKEGNLSSDKSADTVKKFARANRNNSSSRNAVNKTAYNIGGFLSLVNEHGFKETLDKIGLKNLEGKTPLEITFSLTDYLSESFNNIDEVDARNALSRLMDSLFQEADDFEDIEKIIEQNSNEELIGNVLVDFFGYYIYEQFCRVFYERLVQRVGEEKAESYLSSISDYINSALQHETTNINAANINWNGDEGKEITDKILNETLEVFGGVKYEY